MLDCRPYGAQPFAVDYEDHRKHIHFLFFHFSCGIYRLTDRKRLPVVIFGSCFPFNTLHVLNRTVSTKWYPWKYEYEW